LGSSDYPPFSVIIGSGYAPPSEPPIQKEGYEFAGWMCDNEPVTDQIIIENRPYLFCALWEETMANF
jgi:hypothetical protein